MNVKSRRISEWLWVWVWVWLWVWVCAEFGAGARVCLTLIIINMSLVMGRLLMCAYAWCCAAGVGIAFRPALGARGALQVHGVQRHQRAGHTQVRVCLAACMLLHAFNAHSPVHAHVKIVSERSPALKPVQCLDTASGRMPPLTAGGALVTLESSPAHSVLTVDSECTPLSVRLFLVHLILRSDP